MKKVIGYIRVSSEMQKEKGNSVKNQLNMIQNYCSNGEMELVKVFRDEGISGLKNKRNGLDAMMDVVNRGEVDVVAVYSLSRLGRRLVDVVKWIAELEKKGVEFHSIKEGFGSGVVGKLMMNILGSINEFEVSVLGERISDVKQYKKNQMKVYGGKICYGWDREGDCLVINPVEYRWLGLMSDLRESGWSYHRIANYMNNQGVESKEGCQWYGNSVRSVLLNRVLELCVENRMECVE